MQLVTEIPLPRLPVDQPVWSSHLNTSVMCGCSPDMYESIKQGADDPYFTDFERTVIRATEELLCDQFVSDANWNALLKEWNYKQMLDFLFAVGCKRIPREMMERL